MYIDFLRMERESYTKNHYKQYSNCELHHLTIQVILLYNIYI